MNNSRNVLAVIPARGGSKGIFRKNIALLGGKPLIAYSIIAALRSRLIDRIVVSTDDEEIADIAKHYGAEVPFMRPKEMAGDRSSVADAVEYTVDKLVEDGFEAETLVCLFTTSPFRSVAMMERMIENVKFMAIHSMTVKPLRYKSSGLFTCALRKPSRVSYINKLVSGDELNGRYKQIGLICVDTIFPKSVRHGSIFSRTEYIKEKIKQGYKKFEKGVVYEVVDDPISYIDIDTPEDLSLAEEVIKRGLYA